MKRYLLSWLCTFGVLFLTITIGCFLQEKFSWITDFHLGVVCGVVTVDSLRYFKSKFKKKKGSNDKN